LSIIREELKMEEGKMGSSERTKKLRERMLPDIYREAGKQLATDLIIFNYRKETDDQKEPYYVFLTYG
jgi:hypothetical protein